MIWPSFIPDKKSRFADTPPLAPRMCHSAPTTDHRTARVASDGRVTAPLQACDVLLCMKTSLRLIASLASVAVAITISTVASGEAAVAFPIVPPIAVAPVMSLTVEHPLIAPSGEQVYTLQAHYVTGTALSGRITLTRDLHNGKLTQVFFSTTNLDSFAGAGASYNIYLAPIGDETLTAFFVPATAGAQTATASASFQVRAAGASTAFTIGSAITGSPTAVTTTISLPSSGWGYPIAGRVSLQVDALGEQASCLPVAIDKATASCSTALPDMPAGSHYLTAVWSGSPSFQSTTWTVPLLIAPAETSSTSPATAPSATPTPETSPTTAPSPTTGALAGGTDPNALSPATTTTAEDTGGFPLWMGIALAILLIAFLGIAVLVTVGIVRSRRARATA